MGEASENKAIIRFGAIAGSIMAILGLFWFIGEPALELYVANQIELHESSKKDQPAGVKLRELLGYKMGVENDEVHIEIGHQYKQQKRIINSIDSILSLINELKRFDNAVIKEFKYYHPDNLLQNIE